MSFNSKTLLAALAGAATVAAHGHVESVTTGGTEYPAFPLSFYYQTPKPDGAGWRTTATDNGFVHYNDMASTDMACHRDATPGNLFVPIAAGESITLQWDTWPESHKGPVIDYLAPYADSAADLAFTKIAEDGADTQNDGAIKLIANGNSWTVTIPDDIAAGQYVLRHEIIALHGAGDPQFYPQCVNLEITGSGSNSLSGGIPGGQLYDSQEEGIQWNIHNGPQTGYPIPGPALMAGGSSGSPTTPSEPATSSVVAEPTATSNPPASGGSGDSGNGNGGEYEPPATETTPGTEGPAPTGSAGTPGTCLRKRSRKARRAAKMARRNALRK